MNKVKWANLLHIYQPPDWDPKVIKKVARESYRPVLNILKKQKNVKITLNINGSLTEQLARLKLTDLISDLKLLAKDGQIEFVGSAKYHVLLPKLPASEIIRQIRLNTQINQKYFGKLYRPKGFFSPELCFSNSVARLVAKEKFNWMALDEIALTGKLKAVDWQQGYQIKGTKLKIIFRNRLVSDYFLSQPLLVVKKLFRQLYQKNQPIILALDGETFGHHRPGMDRTFSELLKDEATEKVTYSEYLKGLKDFKKINPLASSWASSEKELKKGVAYELWDHPNNPIHQQQWELFRLAVETVQSRKNDPYYPRARALLDQSLNSDPFWWASAHPWWSVEIIEEGALRLIKVISLLKTAPKPKLKKAQALSKKIINLARLWQNSGQAKKERRMFLAGYHKTAYLAGKKII